MGIPMVRSAKFSTERHARIPGKEIFFSETAVKWFVHTGMKQTPEHLHIAGA